MLRIFSLFFLLTFFGSTDTKTYTKNYYQNGKLKEEGWILYDKKIDYWFFYYENGLKKEEGHYLNNQKVNWWIYYDQKQTISRKCQYKSNKLNGITIVYEKGEITRAEKYNNGKKIKAWTDLNEFKKDNNYLLY